MAILNDIFALIFFEKNKNFNVLTYDHHARRLTNEFEYETESKMYFPTLIIIIGDR